MTELTKKEVSRMRNLVITRNKSFVASLSAMKVYIEDASAPETTISGIPCRLLGKIKNGEQQTFSIDDQPRRVFVIPGQMSKSVTCDSYLLPEGADDIYLTGKNHYNPFAGNPFYFDGNTDPTALAARKKSKRIGITIMVCAVLAGLALGFFLTWKPAPKEKVFTCDEMQITLTDEFGETDYFGYKTVYKSQKSVVFVLKESFADYPILRNLTLEEYCQAVIEANKGTAAVETEDGLTYFDYEETVDGDEIYYLAVVYRAENAFWLVQFSCDQKNVEKLRPDFIKWAQSVAFDT